MPPSRRKEKKTVVDWRKRQRTALVSLGLGIGTWRVWGPCLPWILKSLDSSTARLHQQDVSCSSVSDAYKTKALLVLLALQDFCTSHVLPTCYPNSHTHMLSYHWGEIQNLSTADYVYLGSWAMPCKQHDLAGLMWSDAVGCRMAL